MRVQESRPVVMTGDRKNPFQLWLREAEVIADNENERRVRITVFSVGPGNEKQKAFYTQKAVDTSSPIFEGCALGVNHPDDIEKQVQSEGKVQDVIGWLENCKPEGEELKAEAVVYPGEPYLERWIQIKQAIEYAKKYPGKNHIGVSLSAETLPVKPFTFNGGTWYAVDGFAEAMRVDIVTKPARGGKFEKVLSESNRKDLSLVIFESMKKSSEGEAGKIYSEMVSQLRDLEKTNAPGAADMRRRLDKLGSALGLNKSMEGGMDEKLKAMCQEALKHTSEAYAKMAETEADPAKKADFMSKSQAMGTASEGEFSPAHVDVPLAPGAAPAAGAPAPAKPAVPGESEEEDEEEAKTEGEKKAAEAKRQAAESNRKYLTLFRENLMTSLALSDADKGYLRSVTESIRDEAKLKTTIEAYSKVRVEEANRGGGHGFGSRPAAPAGTANKVNVMGALKSRGIRVN